LARFLNEKRYDHILSFIAGVFKLLQKNGKVHKQKVGNISNSQVLNINGDVNKKGLMQVLLTGKKRVK